MKADIRDKYSVRKATADDIPLLVQHHSMMFKEIRSLQGKDIDQAKYQKMEESQAKKLLEEMPKGLCHAWIVEDENKIAAASGAISICSFVPVPESTRYKVAYVHGMYTEEKYRKYGLVKKVIKEIKIFCQQNDIGRIIYGKARKPYLRTYSWSHGRKR